MRRIGTSLALAAVSWVVTLGVAELALRAFALQPLALSYLSDDGLWVHVPGRELVYRRDEFATPVRINREGFRGPEIALPKPAGSERIVALGDSFTEGLQVAEEDLFVTRIGVDLARRSPRSEALNLGVSGYGTADALALLEARGARLEPDLVLLFFCLANDVEDDRRGGRCRLESGALACTPTRLRHGPDLAFLRAKSWLGTHSQLYQLVRGAGGAAPGGLAVRLGLREPDRAAAPAEPFGRDLYREPPPPYLHDGFALTSALLGALQARARALGAELWVVPIPIREQIEDARWREIQAAFGAEPLSRERPQRSLREAAEPLGIPVLDPYEAFRAASARGEKLYWEIDAHLRPEGHAVVADLVTKALAARTAR